MLKRKSKTNKNKNSANSQMRKMVSELKEIDRNTAVGIGMQVMDTVKMPILRERTYSVIMSSSTIFTNSTSVPVFPVLSFTGGAFNDFSVYANVFDKYRILEVEVDFICVNPHLDGNGLFLTVIDYDDDTLLTSNNQAFDYKSCLSMGTSATFKRTLIPRMSFAAYSGAFTSYAEGKSGQWIDCASPSVIHYGIKTVLGASIPQTQYQVVIRAHIQFKNQH